MKTFEDWLEAKHAEQYVGLDDDMPDDFDNWLCTLGPGGLIEHAEQWKEETK